MTATNRPNRLRPFTEPDFTAKNAFDKPLCGWKASGMKDAEGRQLYGHVNDMGFGLLRVVHQKDDKGVWKDLYDQFVLFENPGAIVICTDDAGRVGLVQMFRMVGERTDQLLQSVRDKESGKYDFSAFIRTLRERALFGEALAGLGRMVWELPRGLAPAGEADDLAAFVRKVAQIEAKEEAGFDVDDVRLRGSVNANTTFFPYAQHVVTAKIVGVGDQRPEELETIGRVRMFNPKELRTMCDMDELFDGLTLACLAKAGYRF